VQPRFWPPQKNRDFPGFESRFGRNPGFRPNRELAGIPDSGQIGKNRFAKSGIDLEIGNRFAKSGLPNRESIWKSGIDLPNRESIWPESGIPAKSRIPAKSGIPIWPESRIREIGNPDFAGIGKINPDARASGISGSGSG
jgi:hypothetical protein